MQELKIDRGETSRNVRQWKKEIKESYTKLAEQMGKLTETYNGKQQQINEELERQKAEAEREKQERLHYEIREREREMWEEKFEAELKMAEKRIEMENKAKAISAKLPKLKIIPFKGTAVDWVRFENMFITQVDKSPISDEEKFGYLLESVIPKVRDIIANLKPSSVGYKMAWDRLKKEYGQTKVVVNAHLDEIINLPTVRGTNHGKVQEFYDKLSNNYDALQTLGEGGKLQGFVLSTLNKLPHVKPDLVRVDDNWEEWEMETLISNLQAWLKRNECEDGQKFPAYMGERRNKERSYYGGEGKPKS